MENLPPRQPLLLRRCVNGCQSSFPENIPSPGETMCEHCKAARDELPEYIIDYTESIKTLVQAKELLYPVISIRFISGKTLRIHINSNEIYIEFKIWLLKWIIFTNKEKSFNNDLDLVMDTTSIRDPTGLLTISEILHFEQSTTDVTLTCILRVYDKMITAQCTCENHGFDNNLLRERALNIRCMGELCCEHGGGILIPKDLNPFELPDDIPSIYIENFTDIDWVDFKKKVTKVIGEYIEYLNMDDTTVYNLEKSLYEMNNISPNGEQYFTGLNTNEEKYLFNKSLEFRREYLSDELYDKVFRRGYLLYYKGYDYTYGHHIF